MKKFSKVHLLPILALSIMIPGHGQEGPQIIPPAPNAAKIAQFIEMPTSLYTGSQTLSVPLHTIEFDGVSIPISINYHSGGIRANEDASMVGLGWALNTAGSISRTVKGFNDLRSNGYVYDAVSIAPGPITGIVNGVYTIHDQPYYDHLTGSADVDTEPDVFTYNFLGSTGMFVLSKKSEESDNVIKAIKIEENPDSIRFDEPGKYFTVTLPNGFKGTFDVYEYTLGIGGSSSSFGLSDGCDVVNVDIAQAINQGKRAITTWHLSKIESPQGMVLDFEYLHQPGVFSDYISVSADKFGELQTYYSNLSIFALGQKETCSKNIFEHVYLSKISSTDTGTRILFNMSDRLDVEPLTEPSWLYAIEADRGSGTIISNGAQRLTGINVFNDLAGSTINKTIDFRQGYFNDSYLNDPLAYNYLRLRLDTIIIDDQNYYFEYLNGLSGLPDKSTKGIDYWGYSNGQSNAKLYPEIGWLQPVILYLDSTNWWINQYNYYQSDARKADFNYGQAGLLNKVIYPTGGSTVYDYESHEYKLTGDEFIIPPGGGSAFASGLSGTVTDEFGYIGFQAIQRQGGQIEMFPEGCPTTVDVTFRVMCKDYWTMGSDPCPIDVADRTVVAVELLDTAGIRMQSFAYDQLWGPGLNFFEQTITYQLDAGFYTINAFNIEDGNGVTKYYGEAHVSYAPQCDLATSMTTNQLNFNQVAGGARIAAITSYDQDDSKVLKRSYDYIEDPPVFSSGRLMNPLLYVYQECSSSVQFGDVCIFYSVSGDALPGGRAAQGSHIGYSRVKETFEDPNTGATNGLKWYYYENKSNIHESYGTAPALTFNRENGTLLQEYIPGITTRTVDYNDNFDLVDTPILAIALKGTGANQIGILDYYDITKMFIVPKEIVETVFYPSGDFITNTNRVYNSEFQLASETTTNSKGQTLESTFKYPYDLTAPLGGVYDLMKDKNMLLPVEKTSKVDGNVVSAAATKYRTEGSNVVPDEVYTFNPDLGAFLSTTDGINFGGGYESALQYVNYNSVSGKIEEYVGKDGVHQVFIWGYGLNYPVAKISNATWSDIEGVLGVNYNSGTGPMTQADIDTLKAALPDARITAYTYNPGVGISTVTDPNGLKTTYEYDNFGRLKTVKDNDGNVLQQTEYKYQGQ